TRLSSAINLGFPFRGCRIANGSLMRLSAFFRPELLAFSLLGLMILPAANAQTRELGAFALGAGTLNPGTPDTGSNAASPSPENNEKVESEPDAQPEPGPSAASPGP